MCGTELFYLPTADCHRLCTQGEGVSLMLCCVLSGVARWHSSMQWKYELPDQAVAHAPCRTVQIILAPGEIFLPSSIDYALVNQQVRQPGHFTLDPQAWPSPWTLWHQARAWFSTP